MFYREASSEHSCARTKSQDPLAIYFTSGTTGAPKMVEHTQASYGLGFVASGRYQGTACLVGARKKKQAGGLEEWGDRN